MINFLTPEQQRWRSVWPHCLIGFLGLIQFLLTLSIIGLEITSLIFDVFHSMIFAGFYCSFFFMITWISMFTVTCCNRHSINCAYHALAENILSLIAGAVLIYFDSLFVNNLYTCLYGTTYQCSSSYNSGSYGIYNSTNYTVKLACVIAQLACASAMVLTNLIYIFIFIIVFIKTRTITNQIGIRQYDQPPQVVMIQPANFEAQRGIVQPRTIECHNCHTLIQIA